MINDEQFKKLERLKPQWEILFTATSSKDQAVLTITSLAAAFLVIATFNEKLLPLNNLVRGLITILLVLIPISLFSHLLSADRTAQKAVKNMEKIIGSELPRNQECADCYFSYFPYIAASILSLVIMILILLIWK